MDLSSVCHCDISCFSRFFHLEMHQNNIKFIFDISISKQSKNTQKKSFEEEKNQFF
jgi:hypothetical protein